MLKPKKDETLRDFTRRVLDAGGTIEEAERLWKRAKKKRRR